MEKEYWTIKQYADRTGQSHQAVYAQIKRGVLTTVQQTVKGR